MEELWNKLGAWGYAVPILMLLCLNILLFTDIFEKIIIRCWGISGEYHKEKKNETSMK